MKDDFIIHKPKNTIQIIEKVWAFISVTPDGEGIAHAVLSGNHMPLFGADTNNIILYKDFVRNAAKESNTTIQLVQFSNRELLETIYKAK